MASQSEQPVIALHARIEQMERIASALEQIAAELAKLNAAIDKAPVMRAVVQGASGVPLIRG